MSVRTFSIVAVLVAGLAGCASSGPSQAEAPKPNLDEPKGEAPPGSADAMAALEAAEKKDYAAAKSKGEAVLAKAPNDPVAHFALGVVSEESDKDVEAAEKHYRAALAADPKLVGASIYLSALLVDQKKFDEAADVARKGLAHAKATPELHINLAWALAGKGDAASAAKSMGNAITLKPDDAALRLDQADFYLQAGDKDAAAKAYKNAIAKAKGDGSVLGVAASGLAKAGDPAGCVATWDQVITKGEKPQPLLQRALCKAQAKDLEGALADAKKAIAIEPSPAAHYAAGKYAEAAGDKKTCKTHYAEAAKLAAAAKPGTELEAAAKKGEARCK